MKETVLTVVAGLVLGLFVFYFQFIPEDHRDQEELSLDLLRYESCLTNDQSKLAFVEAMSVASQTYQLWNDFRTWFGLVSEEPKSALSLHWRFPCNGRVNYKAPTTFRFGPNTEILFVGNVGRREARELWPRLLTAARKISGKLGVVPFFSNSRNVTEHLSHSLACVQGLKSQEKFTEFVFRVPYDILGRVDKARAFLRQELEQINPAEFDQYYKCLQTTKVPGQTFWGEGITEPFMLFVNGRIVTFSGDAQNAVKVLEKVVTIGL